MNGSLAVANITEQTPTEDCNLWTNSTGGNINIGTQSSTGLYLKSSILDILSTGTITVNTSTTATFINNNRTMGVNIGTGNFSTINGSMNIFTGSNASETTLNIGTGNTNAATINVATGPSRPLTSITNIGGTVYLGSTTSTTTVSGGMLVVNDVSLNKNVKMGSGSSSVSINKDISSAFALDVSGATQFRGAMDVAGVFTVNGQAINGSGIITTLTVTADSSLNGNLFVGNDLSLNGNLYVMKRSVFTGDVSMNGNARLGTGSNSIAINKDASAGYALDVSGSTILRNPLYVLNDVSFTNKLFVDGDSSFNGNLFVGNDLSLNGNLYVMKRSVFTGDVSMSQNLDIGSGSSSVSINKDISSAFALDVSGTTKFRGDVDVAGTFTVNGAPVSAGGGSLTGNVQVGTNSGFVTIDKPQFYSDPSLTIYYNFDTSINGGLGIKNMATTSTLYDGSLNVNGSNTNLMIDTTVKKFGASSLKNNPPNINNGVTICNNSVPTTFPVSSSMSFSVWVYKPQTPFSATFDRIFEISDLVSPGGDNNTIALDISSSGVVLPVLTYAGAATPCINTISSPIISYNVCNGVWNHIAWTITPTNSYIYINGSNTQIDIINFPVPLTTRKSAFVSYGLNNVGTRDFSGNLDDFRYYNGKALNYAEIYQLYNNSFYTLDICGGFLANGSSVIYEASGSVATANRGTLTLLHGDASGSSSIMFKSVNDPTDYGYVQYDENVTGSTGYHYGLMTIGIENDAGSNTAQADRISLFASGGNGFVGVNTKTPHYSLDVSGQTRIYEGAGTTASATGGSLTLEHANSGGTSSLVFKTSNSSTTSDFAYVQYQDNATSVQSIYKYDFSGNISVDAGNVFTTGSVIIPSTGLLTGSLTSNDSSLCWTASVGNFPSPAPSYCISFNQTNLMDGNTARINYLQSTALNSTNTGNIAASLWINPSVVGGTNSVDVSSSYNILDLSGTTTHPLSIFLHKQKLFVVTDNSTNPYNNSISTDISAGNWYHIAVTSNYINNTMSLYKNNVLQTDTCGNPAPSIDSFVNIALGWRPGFPTGNRVNTRVPYQKGFAGRMVYLNVFNKELSSADVSLLYQNPGYNPLETTERGLMTIGIENDNGYINNDRIVLWPGAGQGYVGINTKDPQYTLDVSGNIQAFSYNATSDYRAKDNVVPLNTSFTVDSLNPVTYKFKATGKQDVGFIAHEVQEFYPFLVNGEKDGPHSQSLNYNGFIGILTKEIQDLKKKVVEQETKALAKAAEQDQRISALEKMVSDLINK